MAKYLQPEKKEKTVRDYIDKDEFYQELLAYKKSGVEKPNDKIGKMIIDIVDKVLSGHRFKNYTDLWKDEMRSEAILACVKSIKNFNPEVSKNPFSYFTTTVYYVFYNVIAREKKINQSSTDYNTELHNDYDEIGADGFCYPVPEQIHDKLANTTMSMYE